MQVGEHLFAYPDKPEKFAYVAMSVAPEYAHMPKLEVFATYPKLKAEIDRHTISILTAALADDYTDTGFRYKMILADAIENDLEWVNHDITVTKTEMDIKDGFHPLGIQFLEQFGDNLERDLKILMEAVPWNKDIPDETDSLLAHQTPPPRRPRRKRRGRRGAHTSVNTTPAVTEQPPQGPNRAARRRKRKDQ